MFENLFKIKPKKFLGIDVGSSYLKVVELRRDGKKISLENYGELGFTSLKNRNLHTFEKDGFLLAEQDVSEVIKSICREAKIQTKEVNFSIPDFSTFFTTFKIPQMTREEISEAIKYEVRPYIPLPLSEITLDWAVTEGEIGKTPLKVLVVAIPNDIINQYQEIAKLSKLELKSLESEVFALARSLHYLFGPENKKETIALIDIGARSTTCSILNKGILKISHSFNMGSNELTEILVRSLRVSQEQAQDLQKSQGLATDSYNNNQKSAREVLLPLVDAIVSEIKKIFRNFYQTEGKEVEKIVLAGGLAFMPGLKEYFQEETGKETEISNPFLNISCPPVLEETLRLDGPAYTVAVGLALKGFE